MTDVMSVLVIFIIFLYILTKCYSKQVKCLQESNNRNQYIDESETNSTSICFTQLGCLEFSGKWKDPECRAGFLIPYPRHIVNTKFLFLSSSCDENNIILYDVITMNPDSITITSYDSSYETVFLIHDFTSNGYTGWIKHITLTLLKKGEYNIISVDWQNGAEAPFNQSISNARLVALETTAMITMLCKYHELKIGSVTLIGHGLGAHIAGYVGKNLRGRIGRIIALDPTGPLFDCLPCEGRLTNHDAYYVEVLHTDGQGPYHQGSMAQIGHVDFFFNQGFNQKGCTVDKNFSPFLNLTQCELPKGQVLPGCSHKRAFKYYLEAVISHKCYYIGVKANDYDDLLEKRDYGLDQFYAISFDQSKKRNFDRSKFFLETSHSPIFCLHLNIITLSLGHSKKADPLIFGKFELTFLKKHAEKDYNVTLNKKENRAIVHGTKESFFVYYNFDKTDFESVRVTWIQMTNELYKNVFNVAYILNVTLTYVKVGNNSEIEQESQNFCTMCHEGTYINKGGSRLFQKC